MKKVGYLGPKGTFSQEAYESFYKDDKTEAVECATINDCIWAVERGEVDEAIVPIENSIEGAVNVTLDLIYKDVELHIIGEIVIPIRHCFMVKEGTKKEDIKLILAHPQSAGQCRDYLYKNFPNVKVSYTNSNSESSKMASEGDGSIAAIGPEKSAEIYGLQVTESGIQDNDNNQTRFIVLSKGTANSTGSDKTSIVFSGEDRPGSLYKILDIFSLWDINLTRIESRPQKSKLGSYIFFVDMEGHCEDEDLKDALTMVKRKTSFYKFLGSYPKHV